MNRFALLPAIIGCWLVARSVSADVPHLLNYQGRVAVGGTNFDGTGQFKFALVNGGSSTTAQATASANVVFGFLVNITVTAGGAGYSAPPAVTITDSTGSGASALAHIAGGQVTSITVLDAGSGYSTQPVVTIAPPPGGLAYSTYWSNDGTSSAGGEPVRAVPLPVVRGLYSVLLGDTTLSNMAALPAEAFTHPDVRLRVWFNDGISGFQLLSPDQRVAAVAYAIVADTVSDGSITSAKLASNAVTSAHIAPGSIGTIQIADGSITAAKLGTNMGVGQGTTPTGGIILSEDPAATNLLAGGYTRLPSASIQPEEWDQQLTETDFTFSRTQSPVWTGTEVIIWGGFDGDYGGYGSNGVRYRVSSNTWSPTSTNGAPAARIDHHTVWTGSQMLIWGGRTNGYPTFTGTGGRYDPQADTWSAINLTNAPSPRSGSTAVWTGTEMIIWGGSDDSGGFLNSGGRYNPSMDKWVSTSTPAPTARANHVAVWTGTEMIVWGGNDSNYVFQPSGGRYNPIADSWAGVTSIGAPNVQDQYKAFWTGHEMIVWKQNQYVESGAAYSPQTDTWRTIPSAVGDLDYPPKIHWTGRELLVLGYWPAGIGVRGGRYDPERNRWTVIPLYKGIPFHPYLSAQIWTGQELLILSTGNSLGKYAIKYSPRKPLYLYQKQ